LTAVTAMPFASHLSGSIYLAGAMLLNAVFLFHAWRLYRHYSDAQARRTFIISIQYLTALFALLLIDHYRWYFLEALQTALY
jgi:protoheme IX farnesyltransferase